MIQDTALRLAQQALLSVGGGNRKMNFKVEGA